MKKQTENMKRQGSALPPIKCVQPAASSTVQTPASTSRKEAADKPQDGIPFLPSLPILTMYSCQYTKTGLPTFKSRDTAMPLAHVLQAKLNVTTNGITNSASATILSPNAVQSLNLKGAGATSVSEDQPTPRKPIKTK